MVRLPVKGKAMSLETLQKVYVERLKDLHSAERQVLEAFPELADAAYDEQLKARVEEHLRSAEEQLAGLDRIFERLGESPADKVAWGMEGLIEEMRASLAEGLDPEILDAELLAAVQKIEHYEISQYETTKAYAELLRDEDTLHLLQMRLDEALNESRQLSDWSEDFFSRMNVEAVALEASAPIPVFGSPEGQEEDLHAEQDIREGRYEVFESVDRFVHHLRGQREKLDKEARSDR